MSLLHVASQEGNLPFAENLISHGANIESKTNNGYAPLHIASQEGHLQIVEYLISHCACIRINSFCDDFTQTQFVKRKILQYLQNQF